MLEDERQETVRGADREEIQRDCRQCDDDRPEDERQQDEAQAEHEREDVRQPVVNGVDEVDVVSGVSSDDNVRVDARERLGDQGRP